MAGVECFYHQLPHFPWLTKCAWTKEPNHFNRRDMTPDIIMIVIVIIDIIIINIIMLC